MIKVNEEHAKKYKELLDKLEQEVADYNEAVGHANDVCYEQQQELESQLQDVRNATKALKTLILQVGNDLDAQDSANSPEEDALRESWSDAYSALPLDIDDPEAQFEEIHLGRDAKPLFQVVTTPPTEAEKLIQERIEALLVELETLRKQRGVGR